MAAPTLIGSSTPHTNASNTDVVTMPTSISSYQPGDLLVVELAHGGAGMNDTAGWSKAWFSQNNTALFYRWMDGTETSTYSFSTGTASAITQDVTKHYRGSLGAGNPIDAFTTGSNVATVNSPTLSMTTLTNNVYLSFTDFKNASRTLTGNPTGFTLRQGTTAGQLHSFDNTQAVAGSTGSLTATFSGGGSTHSAMLYALKPLAILETTGTATGSSTASGSAAATSAATGTSAGAGTATAQASSTAAATGSAAGSATVAGVGSVIQNTTGSAAGSGSGAGVGSSIAAAVGSSSGLASASGSAGAVAAGTGTSLGTSDAEGVLGATVGAVGSASGDSDAEGVAGVIVSTTGTCVIGGGDIIVKPVFIFDD